MPPDAVFDPDTGHHAEGEFARWKAIWNTRLDEMIAGFQSAKAQVDPPMEQFYIDNQFSKTMWDDWHKKQEEIRKTGFASFTEHFFHLWD